MIHTKIKSNNEMSSLFLVYEGSSNIEFSGVRGISHLMEHLICKGLDPHMEKMDELAINNNAFTDFDRVVFYMSGLNENIKSFRQIFMDSVVEFNITEQQLENEKKIVSQEYGNYFGDPMEAHSLMFFRKYLNHYTPLGSIADIESINLDQCKEWFKLMYETPKKIIEVSQDVEDDLYNNLTSTKAEFKFGEYDFDDEGFKPTPGSRSVILCSPLMTGDIEKLSILVGMLSGSLASPLYKIFREENQLCYNIQMGIHQLGNQYVVTIQSLINRGKVVEFTNLFGGLCNDIEKYITPEKYIAVKKRLETYDRIKSLMKYGQGYVGRYIYPSNWDVNDNIIKDLVEFEHLLDFSKKLMKPENWIFSTDDKI